MSGVLGERLKYTLSVNFCRQTLIDLSYRCGKMVLKNFIA